MSTTNLLILAAAGAGIYLWINMPRQAGPVLPPSRVADIPAILPTPTIVQEEKQEMPGMRPIAPPPVAPVREGRNFLKGPIFFRQPF